MPTDGWYYEYRNNSPRIRAWAAHYERKGCHPVKAYRVASDKVRRSHTWPPVS